MKTLALTFCALLGALVATFIGYHMDDKQDSHLVRELYALLASLALGALACYNPPGWVPFNRGPVADVLIIVGLVGGLLLYYIAVMFCVRYGEELNYSPEARKARWRTGNRNITRVITVKDIRRALQDCESQKSEQELDRLLDFTDGLEWIDLDEDDSILNPDPASPTSAVPAEQPAAEIAPASRPEFKAPAAESEKECAALDQHPQAAYTLTELYARLSPEDWALVSDAIRREPALLQIMESERECIALELAGVGEQRCVRLKKAVVYPQQKKAV